MMVVTLNLHRGDLRKASWMAGLVFNEQVLGMLRRKTHLPVLPA
jgi:hypothetical protein